MYLLYYTAKNGVFPEGKFCLSRRAFIEGYHCIRLYETNGTAVFYNDTTQQQQGWKSSAILSPCQTAATACHGMRHCIVGHWEEILASQWHHVTPLWLLAANHLALASNATYNSSGSWMYWQQHAGCMIVRKLQYFDYFFNFNATGTQGLAHLISVLALHNMTFYCCVPLWQDCYRHGCAFHIDTSSSSHSPSQRSLCLEVVVWLAEPHD